MKKLKNLLVSIITITLILVMPAFATSADTYSLPYVIFAGGTDESVQLNSTGITVNGKIFSNGSVNIDGTWVNINGQILAQQGVNTQEMLYMYDDLYETFYPEGSMCIRIPTNLKSKATNINYNYNVHVNGSADLTGNINLNRSFIAKDDIVFNGDVTNKNNCILGSENGDITIDNSNVNINCFIYAPNGTVTINGDYVNISGIIMAERVIINSRYLNLNYSKSVEDYVNGK